MTAEVTMAPASEQRPDADAAFWPQRWLRIVRYEDRMVILFDMHVAVDIVGCGKCPPAHWQPEYDEPRYQVASFWGATYCACGRATGRNDGHQTSYRGRSLEAAQAAFDAAEQSLLEDLP